MKLNRWLAAILIAGGLTASALPQQPAENSNDLSNMSLDDLMKIEVTSASKKAQPLDSAPVAITVITQDDIRRSGALTLPEALRLVPGLNIARTSQNYYAITVRGFNNANFDGSFGDKLLVLIDGRSLYNPYTATVYWEIEDLPLVDVDRIEVIHGPGGTLWGANAVNGVINIITKSANDTLGGVLAAEVGTLARDRAVFRYGWKLSDDTAFRIYGKHGDDAQSQNAEGSGVGDQRMLNELGFRGDIHSRKPSSVIIEGAYNRTSIYESSPDALVVAPYSENQTNQDMITTADLLAKWSLEEKNGAETTVQGYYDYLDYPYTNASSSTGTWDLDLQQQFPASKFGNLIVGGGYRYLLNNSSPGPTQTLIPLDRRDTVYNVFGQDQIKVSAKGQLTLGLKLEQNTYTGFEYEPSVRFLQQVDDNHSWWAAISRAIRTPSQAELSDLLINNVSPPANAGGLPTAQTSFGNSGLESEHLIANELGYRAHAADRITIDVAAFYDLYGNLIYQASGSPYNATEFGVPVTVQPTYLENGEHGNVYGFEVESKAELSKVSRLTVGYSYLQQTPFSEGTSIDAPTYQVFGRLSQDFRSNLQGDAMLYWYDAVPALGSPSYTKLDLHLSWKPTKNLELSAGGQDLLENRYIQSAGGYSIPRSAYIKVTTTF